MRQYRSWVLLPQALQHFVRMLCELTMRKTPGPFFPVKPVPAWETHAWYEAREKGKCCKALCWINCSRKFSYYACRQRLYVKKLLTLLIITQHYAWWNVNLIRYDYHKFDSCFTLFLCGVKYENLLPIPELPKETNNCFRPSNKTKPNLLSQQPTILPWRPWRPGDPSIPRLPWETTTKM